MLFALGNYGYSFHNFIIIIVSHTLSKNGITNCALRRKADFSANIRTHRLNRVEVMKERPVADRGDTVFLNECRYSLKMTLKPSQSEKQLEKKIIKSSFSQMQEKGGISVVV